MQIVSDYAVLAVFLLMGALFVVVNTLIPFFISPRGLGPRKEDPYESGEVPVGSAWIRFDIYYYLFALIFLAFDVEAVFLFPVLVVFRQIPGWLSFAEIALFLGILSFALVYAWRKGIFEWK